MASDRLDTVALNCSLLATECDRDVARFCCSYCNEHFQNESELEVHCRSGSHQSIIMSDCGGDWSFRPPPRGLIAEQYSICQRFLTEGSCNFGEQCCEAHSEAELVEWKKRFQYRQTKIQQAKEKQLGGNQYSEELLENWMQARYPQKVMAESLDYVQLSVDGDLYATMSTKRSAKDWTFTLMSKVLLHHVALLYDAQQSHFAIASIVCSILSKPAKSYDLDYDCQEWKNPDYVAFTENLQVEYTVKVNFKTDIYGTFRQTVVFDFGRHPVLMQRMCVDVLPVTELEKLVETQDTIVSHTARWDDGNKDIVYFRPHMFPLSEEDMSLLSFYEPPHASKLIVTQCVMDKTLTKENYVSRMHELLAVEEMARFEQMSRFNVRTKLQVTSAYMLAPSFNSTAKYSVSGELYARMKLTAVLSEDTPAGRLVLTNCNSALVAPVDAQHRVFEALIEDKGKNFIYLKLSGQCVAELKLKSDEEFHAEVQFQLNRLPLCEMHYAVDKLPSLWLVFPDTQLSPSIPWNPQRHWSEKLDSRLNPKQREAIVAITTPLTVPLPPILLVGPYGTGKTFTLAQAIKQIVLQPGTRVLVCTHSNSAADLYIREYLHPYVLDGHTDTRPLRIYYRNRWVQTVNTVVLQYCLLDEKTQNTSFCMPTMEDVQRHRVIVATLSTSRYLAHLGLCRGFFSHILLDEAAQAMECEAIMPLAMADEKTRIVLAGDHMQLSPEVHSPFARDRGLHVSLLERLYEKYPPRFSCCIMLCENYRSHEAIVQFTSELFYDRQLVAGGKQPSHEVYYPLTFFTARGEDVQEQNSTAFYNNSEVYEIVERVCELQKMWPKAWGKQDENSIGIVSPYADQVFRIRAELRKRRMYSISVERVLNVQGKQFRAIFLSTVRTRHTCGGIDTKEDGTDLGFLSNAKLLNTAITRAQSLVAVVGDPIALCSLGKCRKLWERFIEICQDHKSLHGITWNAIRAQLDGMELKSTYVLNPLAPEFVPNRLRHGDPPTYLASYMGPHGMVFYPSQQPLLPPTRHYYMPGVHPHGLPLYSYPMNYLYGLSPHYLGAPVMLPPTAYSGWNLGNQQQAIAKRTPATPLSSPQANSGLKSSGAKLDVQDEALLARRQAAASAAAAAAAAFACEGKPIGRFLPVDAKKIGGVPRPSPEQMYGKPRSRDGTRLTRDVKSNGYCIDGGSYRWANGVHEDGSANKQYQFLPGVHLPRANNAERQGQWDGDGERKVGNSTDAFELQQQQQQQQQQQVQQQHHHHHQQQQQQQQQKCKGSSSGRLFERRPSRPSLDCQILRGGGGGGDFWAGRENGGAQRAIMEPVVRNVEPPPPPTPVDCFWELVQDPNNLISNNQSIDIAAAAFDESHQEWPPLKSLPQPLYLRQSNTNRAAMVDAGESGGYSGKTLMDDGDGKDSNRECTVMNNGHESVLLGDFDASAAYVNGFPLTYAGALRTDRSGMITKHDSAESNAGGLYKYFY